MSTTRLDIEGTVIGRGMSIFNTERDEVMWFNQIRQGYVQLDTLRGEIKYREAEFRDRIHSEAFVIEGQPPVTHCGPQ